MSHKKLFCSVLVVLLTALWLVGMPADALAAAQKAPLVSDPGLTCTGTTAGKSTVKTKKDGTIKVKVKMTAGLPNDSATVYWTCTNVSNGCHDQACGFISIGTLTTNANGKGKFTTILPSNPFPGSFVHLDLLDGAGAVWDSVFPNIPLGAAGGASGASGGDPTK